MTELTHPHSTDKHLTVIQRVQVDDGIYEAFLRHNGSEQRVHGNIDTYHVRKIHREGKMLPNLLDR